MLSLGRQDCGGRERRDLGQDHMLGCRRWTQAACRGSWQPRGSRVPRGRQFGRRPQVLYFQFRPPCPPQAAVQTPCPQGGLRGSASKGVRAALGHGLCAMAAALTPCSRCLLPL